jgi:hypothetical protein
MIWYKFLRQICFVSLRPNVEAVQQAKQESRVLESTGAKNLCQTLAEFSLEA